MLTCPKCHADVPEQMRFCLQCGTSIAPAPPPANSPEPLTAAPPVASLAAPAEPAPPAAESAPQRRASPTIPLKIAPTPVIAPRGGAAAGDEVAELDDETLKKSFERPVTQAGAVLCRFCKGPLDIDGDFCEQCGAPVSEAAPPGLLRPKPKPVAPPAPPPVAAPTSPAKPVQAGSAARPPVAIAPARPPGAASPLPAKPAARPTPPRTPAPPPPPPAEESPSGLMGKLKGLFKKG